MNGIYDTSRFTFRLWEKGHREIEHYKTLGTWANRFDIIIRLGLKHIKDGETIADVGCAIGTISLCLAMNLSKLKVKCIDVSKTPTAYSVIDYFPEIKNRVTFIKKDICELDEQTDWIICTEVLEHIEDDKLAFKKIYENAIKGLIVTVPNELSNQKVNGHLRTYTMDKFNDLINTMTTNYQAFVDDNLFHCNIGVIHK